MQCVSFVFIVRSINELHLYIVNWLETDDTCNLANNENLATFGKLCQYAVISSNMTGNYDYVYI